MPLKLNGPLSLVWCCFSSIISINVITYQWLLSVVSYHFSSVSRHVLTLTMTLGFDYLTNLLGSSLVYSALHWSGMSVSDSVCVVMLCLFAFQISAIVNNAIKFAVNCKLWLQHKSFLHIRSSKVVKQCNKVLLAVA